MPKSLQNLATDDVQRNLDILKQLVKEVDPAAAVVRGPFHDSVLYYSAMFATVNQQEVAEAKQLINLGNLIKEPDAYPSEVVDKIMSNWLIKRRPGTPARGLITISVREQIGTIMQAGTTFAANGRIFRTEMPYHIRAHAGPTAEEERVLVKQKNGAWTFTVPVVANKIGVNTNIRRGTPVKCEGRQLPYAQRISVTKDFTGGTDPETNTQLLKKFTTSVAGKIWSNRLTNEALIKQHAKHVQSAVSIIGFGDPEMMRDQHALWPGSTGGRVDVYVKPPTGLRDKQLRMTGKVLENRADGTIWEINVEHDDLPGFLYIPTVKKDGALCSIIGDERGFVEKDVDIQTPLEATYSTFQTTTLRVLEPHVTTTLGITAAFVVNFRYVDGIDDLQTHLSRRDVTSISGDILVKSAVPCLTSVIVEISRSPKDKSVNTENIKEAVTRYINQTGFTGRLSSASLMGTVHDQLDGTMMVKEITITGKVRYPDGRIVTLLKGNMITVPNNPEQLVTPKTVAFFQDPNDVHVRVVTVDDIG